MPDIKATVISPYEFAPVGDPNPYPIERFSQRYLAQGDSWFSIGALPPAFTANLLQEMVLSRSTLIVNCARPGKVLELMTNTTWDPKFIDMLSRPNTRWPWDALLLSGGGNDLVAAACVLATAPLDQRLLLSEAEWGPAPQGMSRYVSATGWTTFSTHMTEVFAHVLAQRAASDRPQMPIVMHTYDLVTPRNAPAGAGFGPWLYKAMHDLYGIPDTDWNALSDYLIGLLAALIEGFAAANPNVKVIDTRGTLIRAATGTTGESNDFENEIHPTIQGYDKLATRWRPTLDAL